MHVMWACNTVLPGAAKALGVDATPFGGWMVALHQRLLEVDPELTFTVISPVAARTWRRVEDGRTTHLLLPMADLRRNRPVDPGWWRSLPSATRPDVLHIHGTEYEFALPLALAADTPVAVSVQGSATKCGQAYLAGIRRRDLHLSATVRSIGMRDSVPRVQDEFLARGEAGEAPLLRAATVAIGRTDFDRALVTELAPETRYELCHETLRPQFADATWRRRPGGRRRLYISQASYPIKGFHRAVEALPALVERYPDLEVVVAGSPPFPVAGGRSRLKTSDYGRYIRRLLKHLRVEDRVDFVGMLSAKQVLEQMLATDVFWLPSAMENSSNSLAEAMLIGMPVVAAATGGTPSMVRHRDTGLLYDFNDRAGAVAAVSRLLDDNDEAARLGAAARRVAQVRHDPATVADTQLAIYRRMINGN